VLEGVSIHDVTETRNTLPGARAGIRTRVSGMKTRDDGPGYTTRANDLPCHLLFITVGQPTLRQVVCLLLQNSTYKIVHRFLREGFGFVQVHCSSDDVASKE
jgi:hypothetical protein